jgi:Flp pilus assembly protein TadG
MRNNPASSRKRPARKSAFRLRALVRDARGVAAIEFAFIAGFLAIAVLNVADVAMFYYQKLEANNATQVGAQAVWATCDLNHIPATVKCPNMNAAITRSIQSTSLGASVTLSNGYPTEAYYCVNSSGALQRMSDVASEPADCTAAGSPTTGPADYVVIQTTYTYTPLFTGMSVGSLLPSTIVSTSWVRLG